MIIDYENKPLRNAKSIDIIQEIYKSNNIINLITKYSQPNPKNKKECKTYKATLKRIIDYHISQLIVSRDYSSLYCFIKDYIQKSANFSYSTINIIFQHFVDIKKELPLIYSNCDSDIINEQSLNKQNDVFNYIIELIYNKSTKENIKCNKKFTRIIIDIFYHHFHYYYYENISELQLSTDTIIYIYTQFLIVIEILSESNIYLDEEYITKMCCIYKILYSNNVNNDVNNIITKCITTLSTYINTFILTINNYEILSTTKSNNFNINPTITNNVLYLTSNCLSKINELKTCIFNNLEIEYKRRFKCNKNICYGERNQKLCKWYANMFKDIEIRFLNNKFPHSVINNNTIYKIIDGRNTYYNNYSSELDNKLDLTKLRDDIYKFLIADNDNSSVFNDIIFVFNCRHYKIIKNILTSTLSRLDNSNIVDYKKNYKVRTLKNYLDKKNKYSHIKISNYFRGSSVFIFTPRGVDDDIMSIYIKLNYPLSIIKTNDVYGKYGEFVHSNNYYYTLWSKLFEL
jgi:hypothetical protein